MVFAKDKAASFQFGGSPSSAVGSEIGGSAGEKAMAGEPIPNILIVDDDEVVCTQLKRLYNHTGYQVVTTRSAEEALERVTLGDVDLVVTDVRLPGLNGVGLTKRLKESLPDVAVIVITGYPDIGSAVELLKQGASDYIVKPFSAATVLESTKSVLERAKVFLEIRCLRRYLKDNYNLGGMLSKAPEMHRVFEIIRLVAPSDTTVLIEGETGTGKELVARAIHYQSQRRERPLISINCAGIPETLLESELFGCERGAYTGASRARPGKIELAHGGTLFLDEIESMSLGMQAKFLRVLEDRKVQRLGGSRTVQVDIRVVAASNIDLQDLVEKGQIRSDFFYRISVITVSLIPLRERREDIPLLVHDFLRHHPVATNKRITRLSRAAKNRLMEYHWPGNVRELQNVLEKAIVLSKGEVIDEVDLPTRVSSVAASGNGVSPDMPLRVWLKKQEKEYLLRQLERHRGRISLTAMSCGVDEKTLYRKLRLHGLDKRVFRSADKEFHSGPY